MTSELPILRLDGVNVSYGDGFAVEDLDLTINGGEFLSIVGPSGSGKSTLLKVICGVIIPTAGTVSRPRRSTFEQIEPTEIVMVWQSLALFPHLDVEGNVAFGLVVRGIPKAKRKQRVREALELVGLRGYQKRRVNEISGGEKQRVALARALVVEPKVVLLDEPFGGLDNELRDRLINEFRMIHKQTGITFVMVTHNQFDALAVSTRIVVLNRGRIQQVGLPHEVFERPVNAFVAQFLGEKNVFKATVVDVNDRRVSVSVADGRRFTGVLPSWIDKRPLAGDAISYVVPADRVSIDGNEDNSMNAEVNLCLSLGRRDIIEVMDNTIGVVRSEFFSQSRRSIVSGKVVRLSWNANDAYVLPYGN